VAPNERIRLLTLEDKMENTQALGEPIEKVALHAHRAFKNAVDYSRINRPCDEIEISGSYYRGIYHLCFGFRGTNGKIHSTTNVIIGD